jgi:hypothetical protein
MPVPPRPKRFQIHLSTAVGVLFVCGVLLMLNLGMNWAAHAHSELRLYGWPISFCTVDLIAKHEGRPKYEYFYWKTNYFLANLAVNLAVVFAVYFLL